MKKSCQGNLKYFKVMLPKLQCAHESPGELAKMQIEIQWFKVRPRFCICNEFLGDVDAAGAKTTH